MSDHGKRNWQRAMHDRADLAAAAAAQDLGIPATAEALQLLHDLYAQGYRAGRESLNPRGDHDQG